MNVTSHTDKTNFMKSVAYDAAAVAMLLAHCFFRTRHIEATKTAIGCT